MVAVIVLAAGFSRRMNGTDKLFLNIKDKPMYEHAMLLAQNLKPDLCIVVTNNDKIANKASECGFFSVKSPFAENGMGNSVSAGVKALDTRITHAVFLNADQPFICPDTVKKLISLSQMYDKIVVPVADNKPTSPCVFPKRFFNALEALNGEQGGKTIWKQNKDDVLFENVPQNQMIDVDTNEQYQNLQKN